MPENEILHGHRLALDLDFDLVPRLVYRKMKSVMI